MGIQAKVKTSQGSEMNLEHFFGKTDNSENLKLLSSFLPPEWFPQSGVQLTWPHECTDWEYMLQDINKCYIKIAYEIASREPLLIVSPEPQKVKKLLSEQLPSSVLNNIKWAEAPINDTWARDHGFITVLDNNIPVLLDFCFNGWGNKFEAEKDNALNRILYENALFNGEYKDCLDFILEGGSIESDGKGTILTTSECLLSKNRNVHMDKNEIENKLKQIFYAQQVLWLDNGFLRGDDTDSHIDTLARFCPNDTIVYVKCNDYMDEHYESLQKMEEQLKAFKTLSGEPFNLLPLPMVDPIYDEDGERLPATYANFLIINNAVLLPIYSQPENDNKAIKVLQDAFPGYDIVTIDCRPVIRQHGSLHCCTMQFPRNVLK